MDFREMLYITTVADCKSVTAAAKKLYISQPSLSYIISKVEQDGNFAAAIVLMAIVKGTFVPALQILDYPGVDLATPAGRKRNGNSNPRIPAWKGDFYNKMYVNPEDTKEIYCSPGFASDEQLAKMPPTVLIYCDNDTFCDEDAEFHKRLLEQGVPVYGKRFFNSNHGFTIQRNGEYETAEKMILGALKVMQ